MVVYILNTLEFRWLDVQSFKKADLTQNSFMIPVLSFKLCIEPRLLEKGDNSNCFKVRVCKLWWYVNVPDRNWQ